jgi:hypothetical protein
MRSAWPFFGSARSSMYEAGAQRPSSFCTCTRAIDSWRVSSTSVRTFLSSQFSVSSA